MRTLILSAVFMGLLVWALIRSFSSAAVDADVTGEFGSPIPGLAPFEQSEFELGREIFQRRWTRAQGLGPHFNASSCFSCHEEPVAGGSGQRYRDFFIAGRTLEDGSVEKVFPDCSEENVSTHDTECCLPSIVIPHYGPKGTIADPVAADVEHPRIPAEADVVARRNAPPIFGVGLFRLIPDAEILSRADPNDEDGDGISGRVNIISTEDDAIGRLGFKCQTSSIEAFNRGALHNQMGITSDSLELVANFPHGPPGSEPGWLEELLGSRTAWAQATNPRDRIVDYDDVRDPEINRGELRALVFFQEHLAAPRRGLITNDVREGEELFRSIGCTGCHVESLETAIGMIHPYTDLLIHDMGEDLADGFVMELAGPSEFRTQPLWGLREHAPFLHDGRADTAEEAILLHGGEASAARDAYQALVQEERQLVLRFLESL